MVNTLSHLGIGLLIALALGYKGKKREILAFLAILPDMDFSRTSSLPLSATA